jgi:hypothetical protein
MSTILRSAGRQQWYLLFCQEYPVVPDHQGSLLNHRMRYTATRHTCSDCLHFFRNTDVHEWKSYHTHIHSSIDLSTSVQMYESKQILHSVRRRFGPGVSTLPDMMHPFSEFYRLRPVGVPIYPAVYRRIQRRFLHQIPE